MDNTLPPPDPQDLLDEVGPPVERASRGGSRKVVAALAVALVGGAVGGGIIASASNGSHLTVASAANSSPASKISATTVSTASSGSQSATSVQPAAPIRSRPQRGGAAPGAAAPSGVPTASSHGS